MQRKHFLVVALFAVLCPAARAGAQVAIDTIRVSVDGHEMAMFVAGTSGPMVVLDAGGTSHNTWTSLANDLAGFARVVMYDRPGYGLSETCGRTRSGSVIARELKEALGEAGLEGPFLLVGWSHAGSFMRAFAAAYPESAGGLLLLDPAIEGFYTRAAAEHTETWNAMYRAQVDAVAKSAEGHRQEWAAWDRTMEEVREADRRLRLPITLITSTRDEDGLQPIWIAEHHRWAATVTNVTHILPGDVGHAIHRERPALVVSVIRRMTSTEGA